jgi:hypothetical protein
MVDWDSTTAFADMDRVGRIARYNKIQPARAAMPPIANNGINKSLAVLLPVEYMGCALPRAEWLP